MAPKSNTPQTLMTQPSYPPLALNASNKSLAPYFITPAPSTPPCSSPSMPFPHHNLKPLRLPLPPLSTYLTMPPPTLTPSCGTIAATWYYTSTATPRISLPPKHAAAPVAITSSVPVPLIPNRRPGTNQSTTEASMLNAASSATSWPPPPKPRSVPYI
jgi:hypothetical protein